jgi:hypothetical protein
MSWFSLRNTASLFESSENDPSWSDTLYRVVTPTVVQNTFDETKNTTQRINATIPVVQTHVEQSVNAVSRIEESVAIGVTIVVSISVLTFLTLLAKSA